MNKKHIYPIVILLLFLAVGIQPTPATIYLTPTGWEDENGNPLPAVDYLWDQDSLTGTLTQDVSETIIILNPSFLGISEDDRITLVGDGHTISGVASGTGVDLGAQADIGHGGSLYVTIENLNVTGCAAGITLNPSGYCNVINNTISNCQKGIYMWDAGTCLIEGNTVSSCDYGIHIQAYNVSLNNTLKNNTIEGNNIGVEIGQGAHSNKIYNNNFINNGQQAKVHQTGNDFYLNGSGNYWDDYTGVDDGSEYPVGTPRVAGDGIGDTELPYTFTGGEDIYPWVIKNGWSSPVNQSPVADAGPDQIVEQENYAGASVTLDGSGSSDDGQIQPLTYTWTWPGGSSATGDNPTVILPSGTTTVTLTVDDGQFSDTDTVDITVEDTTPPDISCPGDTTIVSIGGVPVEDEQIQTFLASASAYDDCDPLPVITNDAPAVFTPGDTIVNFTATDASGNWSSCFSTVTVVEPAEVIEQILLDIELMDVPKKAKKEMGKAVKELNKAIDEFNKDRIDKALNNIAKAVKHLMKAQKKGTDTQDIIDELIDLVQGIAETAIEDAIEAAGEDNRHVIKAQEHYDKALENLADGKYDKAIKEFKNAYRDAMKALG